jgi:hypothetical protein
MFYGYLKIFKGSSFNGEEKRKKRGNLKEKVCESLEGK